MASPVCTVLMSPFEFICITATRLQAAPYVQNVPGSLYQGFSTRGAAEKYWKGSRDAGTVQTIQMTPLGDDETPPPQNGAPPPEDEATSDDDRERRRSNAPSPPASRTESGRLKRTAEIRAALQDWEREQALAKAVSPHRAEDAYTVFIREQREMTFAVTPPRAP